MSKQMAAALKKLQPGKRSRKQPRALGDDMPSGTAKRKRKAVSGPRRPKSAWMYYSAASRAGVQEAHPAAGFGQVAALLGAGWRALSVVERAPFEVEAAADKARYEEDCVALKEQDSVVCSTNDASDWSEELSTGSLDAITSEYFGIFLGEEQAAEAHGARPGGARLLPSPPD